MTTLTQTHTATSRGAGLPSTIAERPNALIVVDAQRGFINAAGNSKTVMNYIHWLLDSPQFDVVIATQFVNLNNSSYRRALDYNEMTLGDVKTNLDERVESRADLVVTKYGYGIDSLDMDGVDELLRANDIDSVLVVGFDTDACVLATAYSLFDAGIVPVIDSRGCASSGGAAMHDAALKIAARNLRVI